MTRQEYLDILNLMISQILEEDTDDLRKKLMIRDTYELMMYMEMKSTNLLDRFDEEILNHMLTEN